jgi:hypothetical protein
VEAERRKMQENGIGAKSMTFSGGGKFRTFSMEQKSWGRLPHLVEAEKRKMQENGIGAKSKLE